jgi:hypothetical protein
MSGNRLPVKPTRRGIENLQNIATNPHDCDKCVLSDLCTRGGSSGSCIQVEKENIDIDLTTPNILIGNLFGSR